MKTNENLLTAFAGESQANRKYLAFARKAESEGLRNAARLFSAVAEAETIHALKHFEQAGQVGSTKDNLKKAVEGETYEFTEMYPEFIAVAKAEGNEKALRTLHYANEAEKVHGGLFAALKAEIDGGKDMDAQAIHLCPVCGWVGYDPAPERCPICGTLAKMFKQF